MFSVRCCKGYDKILSVFADISCQRQAAKQMCLEGPLPGNAQVIRMVH